MPYIILFVVIFIFLGFTLVFQWLLKDNIRQPYIVGLTLFYFLCTLIRRSPSAAHFIGNLTHGWALIIYALSLVLSIWCAVCYMMNIIPNYKFRFECGIFMLIDLVVLLAAAVMRYYAVHFYLQFFFVAILCVSSISIVMAIYYTVKCWSQIEKHNRILLIVTFIMICWFIGSLVLNIQDSQYVYVCGAGIVLYFLVYTVVSVGRLRQQMLRRSQVVAANTDNNINYINSNTIQTEMGKQSLEISKSEQEILDIMKEHNVTSTKEISLYTDKSFSAIDALLSRLMKKLNMQDRKELIG